MKVFVVYASAGTGHFKAAEALYNYIKERDKSLKIELIDVLQYSNFLFRRIYTYGYNFLIHHCLWLWALGFYITYTRILYPLIKSYTSILNRLNTKKAADLFTREQPDIIVSTHFLPSKIASYLKRKKKISSRLMTVITDFGVHPFWICDGTDTYIVASQATKEKLLDEGVEAERIKELGIPVDVKFLKQYNKDRIRSALSIDKNKITILVVTGSFGIGPLEEIVGSLYQEVQVLVVCARNKKLFQRLKRKNYPNVKVFAYVDNMHELMSVSDIIITKPGGVTISELLIMELAPVFISAITGQETENLKIMQAYGICAKSQNPNQAEEIVLDYKRNPERLIKIKEKIRKIKKPSALEELFDVIR